ncbi:MAG: 1-deoxy-D-xylulose-5-phosphate reductoisomerase [Magnetococcales bacterium]|nr:1-deoxy-D-xylulose-5-phosphate reductoisomerase [Magnetococcales bacterium]
MQSIAVLGCTGSIGVNTLRVAALHPDRFRIVALSAGSNSALVIEQAKAFRPEVVAVNNPDSAKVVKSALEPLGITVLQGVDGVVRAAEWDGVTLVISAIVGAAGLLPTLAAIRAGKNIGLANKECLVMAGELMMAEVKRHQVTMIPVDSEHSAIFQVFHRQQTPQSLVLTASGGPFRGWKRDALTAVTPAQALAHPNWSMGRKISIDSATMMNKGLEVIEARWLFNMPPERIRVAVHPESIVHSMVTYADGSVLAQMGLPDMRTPIALALSWPERIESGVETVDLPTLGTLTFEPPPERDAFACLWLAFQALEQGGTAPAILNAANEIAVESFLTERIAFLDIPTLIEESLMTVDTIASPSMEQILDADHTARQFAESWVQQR